MENGPLGGGRYRGFLTFIQIAHVDTVIYLTSLMDGTYLLCSYPVSIIDREVVFHFNLLQILCLSNTALTHAHC